MRLAEPSERNHAIFAEVEFQHASLRSVAERYGISPTRVQQVVEQVRQWYQANTPAWVRTIDPARQRVVAFQIFDQRLAHLSELAMEAWRQSQGGGELESPLSKVSPAGGRPSYLLTVARLDKMRCDGQAKLCQWLEEQGKDLEAIVPSEGANPCARDTEEAPAAEAPAVELADASDDKSEAYDDAAVFAAAVSLPLTSAPTPVRSRKERRRRQRLLQRALGRK